MPRAKKSNYPEITEIREDLDSLKDNVVELTKHIRKDSLKQVGQAGTVAKKRLEELKYRGRHEMKKVEKQVKQKPAQSLAIAFAGGLIASMLLRGRR